MQRRNRAACGCGALLLLAIGAAWWLQRPSYLELPIEVKTYPHRKSFWTETHYTQVRYGDTWGAVYLCRKTGDAHAKIQGWTTPADAMAFFDQWLRQHGWQYLKKSAPADSLFPEAHFLQDDTGYRFYKRQGASLWDDGPWVAVAVEPVYEGAVDVTVVTGRSSWLRQLHRSFD